MNNSAIISKVFDEMGIYSWNDGLEVIVISLFFYKIISWLSKDKSKLLSYFYLYISSYLLSYYLNLPFLAKLFVLCAPIAALLAIVLHEKTLQSHFVASKKKYHKAHHDWIAEFIKASLIAMNQYRSFLCIIERTDSLEDLMNHSNSLDAKVYEMLISCLIKSPVFKDDQMIWINQKGRLISFNMTWRTDSIQHLIHPADQLEPRWRQTALFYTKQTDAIAIKLHPTTRTFEIISQGAIAEHISAAQLASFLEIACDIKQTHLHTQPLIFKEIDHGAPEKNFKQHDLS